MTEPTSVKVRSGRRLIWYEARPDDAFWHEHWGVKVSPAYYEDARRRDLGRDELGRVLAEVFDREGRLIEAGCGAGWYVAALGSAGYDVDGVESSEPLVQLVNRVEPSLPVRRADVTALPEADETYRSYLSIGVVEHREAGPQPFLSEAFRVLEPGGRAVFTVPSFGPVRRFKARVGLYGRQCPPHLEFFQYGYTGDELAELIAEAGFLVDRVGYYGTYRLLSEEIPLYRWATRQRGGERLVRRPIDRLLAGRDGHMVLVVATKPS
ncbi:MAG: class I SAM-dependent methyltransferase [Acidimicrobiales bacterium]|nr:class I SAM-dependent methyltransferase [Acidimicrobiales bacterium]